MRDYSLADGQSRTNPTSTGTISTNIKDLEQDSSSNVILTDDMIQGVLNVVLTSVSYTSGGTEGITIELRTDDATDLATAKDGSSAGYVKVATKEVCLEDIAAGLKIAVPFIVEKAKRYIGGWLRATSTTYTGTIACDMWIDFAPITQNDAIQKVPSRS